MVFSLHSRSARSLPLHTAALAVAFLRVALRLRLALLLLILLKLLGQFPRQECAHQEERRQYDQDLDEESARLVEGRFFLEQRDCHTRRSPILKVTYQKQKVSWIVVCILQDLIGQIAEVVGHFRLLCEC